MDSIRNDALSTALRAAVGGNRTALEALLIRHSGLPSPLPNLKFAATFGAEIGLLAEAPVRLLTALGEDPNPAESPRSFLPVAAAYGWIALVREAREVEVAWAAIFELAADLRRSVRLSMIAALRELAVREGAADVLVQRASDWLEVEDQAVRFSASAVALEALSDSHVLGAVQDPERLFAYLSRAFDSLSNAPRSAERLEGRRRMLTSLVAISTAAVRQLRAADRGANWLAAECERATHPDIRAAFSEALLALGKSNLPRGTVDRLRKTLEASAKPVRDAARVRPGTGRGRRTRSIR